MFYLIKKVFTILISISVLNISVYSQDNLKQIDTMIKEKKTILTKTPKSHTTQYISTYDAIAALTISKNELLLKMDRVDDIDTDKTCELAMNYAEVEFIKTQYYKTPFHDEVAQTMENIALLLEQCHPPMAEQYLKPILKIKEHIYTKESAEVAKTHDLLGDYYRIYMANFKKAIKEYDEAKKIRETLYGVNDPRVTENYDRLALSLYYHGDKLNRAEKLLLASIAIRKNASTSKQFPLYSAYMDIGLYYSMKEEYDKSIIYLQEALTLFKGKVDSSYIVIISELSQIYLNKGDLEHALKFAKEAYDSSKKFYGNDTHIQVLENFNRLTEINDRINK